MNKEYFYEILVTAPFNKTFTYSHSTPLYEGQLVYVNFRNRLTFGMIASINQSPNIELSKIKKIDSVLDFNLPNAYQKFLLFFSKYNMIDTGKVLKGMLAAADVLKKPEKYTLPQLNTNNLNLKLAELNQEQQSVYEEIASKCDNFSVSVIKGITGSGKTEIYLNLAANIIKNGGQVLILLPEIALASQLIKRYEERLGIKSLVWNSQEGQKSKKITWLNAATKNYPLIVGARSALLIPMKNLKMIIIDEEHDLSFKQEESGCYNARDMAAYLAKLHNIPLILASATPAIETIHNCKSGKYNLYNIASRYGDSYLPKIKLVNINEFKPAKDNFIAKPTIQAIGEQLQNNMQVLVYLNRRGFSPVSFCGNCGYKYECPECSANLVKHRSNNFLGCHYCGFKLPVASKCENCGVEDDIFNYGPGVEKIEEELHKIFPEAKILIFSSDAVKPKDLKYTVEEIKDGKFDIIIGTQMITKGFHFPKLNTVIILDFDWSIKGFDLRAHEKTFQSLYQVSGRAGRESQDGQVIIQTIEPDNYLLDVLQNQSFDDFLDIELEERKLAEMPPFTKIGMICLEAKNELSILSYIRQINKAIPEVEGISVLGPSPAPTFKLRGNFRYRYIVIAKKKDASLQQFIASLLNSCPKPRNLKIKIDIDPMNFG